MRIWTTVIGQRLDGAENTRSMLLCAELLRRGHEVTMWTSAYDHIRKEWRSEWLAHPEGMTRDDGLTIRFLKGCGYPSNLSVRRFVDHYLAARDFSRAAAAAERPDVIVASLPDQWTAAAAVAFGRRTGVPTIVDVRDKWPDVFFDRIPKGPLSAIARVVLRPEERRAQRALRDATALVANMNSMMEWGLEKAKRRQTDRERVFYLTTSPKNFDVPAPAVTSHVIADALRAVAGRTVLTFVGTFNKTQSPLLVLDALDVLRRDGRLDGDRTAVIIAGSGLEADEVARRAALHPDVHYVGWVDTTHMSALLAASHVGLLPLNFVTPAFNNKAFAYLASGLPIINGATGDLAEIVEKEHAGINVPAGRADLLADAMHRLIVQPELRETMAANVRRLFLARFDRGANYAAYADHVESIARQSAP
jgi:glycosyltransferase involved in cell wall biosynthesis